jgi:hypothetical protein
LLESKKVRTVTVVYDMVSSKYECPPATNLSLFRGILSNKLVEYLPV